MKDKATIHFRRLQSGDVIGEVVGDNGEVLVSRNFGNLSDEEITKVLRVLQEEHPDTVIQPVRLTKN